MGFASLLLDVVTNFLSFKILWVVVKIGFYLGWFSIFTDFIDKKKFSL
jgi:hypothetical protein